jgi:hypothetical protein
MCRFDEGNDDWNSETAHKSGGFKKKPDFKRYLIVDVF